LGAAAIAKRHTLLLLLYAENAEERKRFFNEQRKVDVSPAHKQQGTGDCSPAPCGVASDIPGCRLIPSGRRRPGAAIRH
jgi:hypothetical protein